MDTSTETATNKETTTDDIEQLTYIPSCFIKVGKYTSFKNIDDDIVTKFVVDHKKKYATEENKSIYKRELWTILKKILAKAKVKVVDEIVGYIKNEVEGKTINGQLVVTWKQVPSWYMNIETTDNQRCYAFYGLFDVDKILEMTRIIKNELGIRYIQKHELHSNSESDINMKRTRKYGEVGKGVAVWLKRHRDAVS